MPNNLFEELMEPVNIMHQNTVWNEKTYDNGREFHYHYWGAQKHQVVSVVKDVVSKIDTYRCPTAGDPYLIDGMWNVDLKYYGLD
jgi:hypothetical protein